MEQNRLALQRDPWITRTALAAVRIMNALDVDEDRFAQITRAASAWLLPLDTSAVEVSKAYLPSSITIDNCIGRRLYL